MAVVAALASPECTDHGTQLGCKVGILGNGDERMYPSRRVPAWTMPPCNLLDLILLIGMQCDRTERG